MIPASNEAVSGAKNSICAEGLKNIAVS